MTQEDAFLHTISENPNDDPHRLVFADWLEENGQPERAEFIRVQVELEPHRFELDRFRVRELLAREEELLALYEEEWLGPAVATLRADLAASDPPAMYGPFFRRGVPELAAIHLDVLLGEGEDMLAAHPTIRDLAVFDLLGRGEELARSKHLNRMIKLEVAEWLEEEDTAALLTSPSFRCIPTVRVWAGSDFDREHLWHAPPSSWPVGMRIEVVEFSEAGRSNSELDELARSFTAAGRTLVPVRPALGRFPLLPNEGQNLHPGRLPDGRQVLFAHGRYHTDSVVFAYFDDEGNLVEARQAEDPGCCRYYEDYPGWLAKEFGYSPCLIWMKEFQTHLGLGVELLPISPAEFIGTGDLWWWLYQGKYVINWCSTPWASRRTGEITDT